MLGKLIKHELKSTAHTMLVMFLAAGITFVVMMIVLLFKVKILMTLSTIAMVLISIAVLVITLYSIITSFNKSLYGAQGYLSFTLPVTSRQLLASKTIVSMIWVVVSIVFTTAVIAILTMYRVAQTSDNVKQVVRSVYDLLRTMQDFPDPKTAVKVIILSLISMLVFALCIIFRVAFSLAVANTKPFQKINPILIAIVIYALLYFVVVFGIVGAAYIPVGVSVGANGFHLLVGDAYNDQMMQAIPPLPILSVAFDVVMSFLLYLTTINIMNNHVNIK